MSAIATLAATAVSGGGLAYLAATDGKRRRAFRLPPAGPRRGAAAWAAVLLPGVVLPVWSGAAGFFVWLGATAVLGWAIGATAPGRIADLHGQAAGWLRARLGPLPAPAGRCWYGLRVGPPSEDLTKLAQRVRRHEAKIAALNARLPPAPERDAGVIEPARAPQPIGASGARSS